MKVILFTGCPRSGLTLLSTVMARHRELAWCSQYYHRTESQLALQLQRAMDLPLLGNLLLKHQQFSIKGRRVVPQPIEPLLLFKRRRSGDYKDWNTPLSEESIRSTRKILTDIPRLTGRRHLFLSMVQPCSLPNFKLIFPEAQIFHFTRDGRAVAHSLSRQNWTSPGPYWDNRLSHEWLERWHSGPKTLLGYSSLIWKWNLDRIWEESDGI